MKSRPRGSVRDFFTDLQKDGITQPKTSFTISHLRPVENVTSSIHDFFSSFLRSEHPDPGNDPDQRAGRHRGAMARTQDLYAPHRSLHHRGLYVSGTVPCTDMAKHSKDGLRDIARAARRDRDARKRRLPRRTPQHKCHMCIQSREKVLVRGCEKFLPALA